jgi:RNA-splicing ligase RtcB
MDLKIFAKTVEQEVHDQLKQLMSVNVFKDAKVRIMPDTHAGKGCVIGFTADLGDKVVPNLVGVDIGCGMYVVYFGQCILSDLQLAAIDSFIHENIPSGMNANSAEHSVGFANLQDLKMWKYLKNVEHLYRSIGTLGGGNHFIELDKDENNGLYLVIHTGSRNLGQQVCKYYQNIAIDECNNKSNELKGKVAGLVTRMRLNGQQKDIQSAIEKLREEYKCVDKVPADLCYLTGESRGDYLHDMKICQEYAVKNREEIARRICEFMKAQFGLGAKRSFHTVHNYIDFEDNIIRKGSIRCNKGEEVIIPLNMRDGSILAIGKGNEDWNCSGPHGAGRLMSRKEAKQSISMKDFADSMCGIYTTSVNEGTLDESPMAYKNAQEIIEAVKDTIDIVEVIKPLYNFKASE